MFSKAAVWLVIALVLFTVFKQFDTRQGRGGDMPYSQFMSEAREGRIEKKRSRRWTYAAGPFTRWPHLHRVFGERHLDGG